MNNPKLGFKLWKRNQSKKVFNYFSSNKLGAILNIALAVFGIVLAFYANQLAHQSNNFSRMALLLAQNDTSQQAQINQLKDILLLIKAQNDLSKDQVAQLININREANNINQSNHELLGSSQNQNSVLNKELKLLLKNDSISMKTLLLANESDLLNLRKLFEEIIDIKKARMLAQLYKSDQPSFAVITDFRITLENGISNRLFLTDSVIKRNWYSFYLLVKDNELMAAVYMNRGDVKLEDLRKAFRKFDEKYFIFVNAMLKRLNYLEGFFIKENYINL